MKPSLISIFVVVLGILLLVNATHDVSSKVARVDDLPFEFVISLDDPPRERWKFAIQTLLKLNKWEHSYKPAMDFIRSMIPDGKKVLEELDPHLTSLGDQFGEIGEEMHGIYSVINETYPAHMTFGELVLMNIFYDVTAGCTSIVGSSASPYYCSSNNDWRFPVGAPPSNLAERGCASRNNSKIIHGRNLDFPIPGLPNITSVVHFKRGGAANSPDGEVVLRGVTYLGYVGILTGYRPGGWSVSVDQRNEHFWKNSTNLPIVDNIISFLLGGQSLGTFLRSSLLTIPKYEQAKEVLSNTRLVAPVYLIIGGVSNDEGAVITRDRDGIDTSGGADRGFWSIDRSVTQGWYRAQTNDDNWLPAGDDRREIAYKAMEQVGSLRLNTTTMFDVMHTPRILNGFTTFSTYMSPAYDLIHTAVIHRNKVAYNEPFFLNDQPFYARFKPNN